MENEREDDARTPHDDYVCPMTGELECECDSCAAADEALNELWMEDHEND